MAKRRRERRRERQQQRKRVRDEFTALYSENLAEGLNEREAFQLAREDLEEQYANSPVLLQLLKVLLPLLLSVLDIDLDFNLLSAA